MKKIVFIMLTLLLMLSFSIEVNATPSMGLINMGEFKITYYCSCKECSEEWNVQTATGTGCVEGRTVAVDPNVISYGTRILIDDDIFVAEDCGGLVKGDHIDIYVNSHEKTKDLGVEYKNIYVIRDNAEEVE